MGTQRNGARKFLDLIKIACQLSHFPGFRPGVAKILGPTRADDLFSFWDPFCNQMDLIIAADDHYNRVDTVAETTGDEDITVE